MPRSGDGVYPVFTLGFRAALNGAQTEHGIAGVYGIDRYIDMRTEPPGCPARILERHMQHGTNGQKPPVLHESGKQKTAWGIAVAKPL